MSQPATENSSPANRRVVLVVAGLIVLAGAGAFADWYSALPVTAKAHYVGRNSCAQCHTTQVDHWQGSHHDRAMELPTDESVLGDFDDSSFTRFGVTTKFFRRDGKYFVNTEGPDGEFQDFEVKYTFGCEPLQQYMVEFPDGRVQVLRVSWDTVKKEWFYVTPPDVLDERILPEDPLHWTGIGQNWNTMCAECHSTNLEKNFDPETNTYATTYSEIDVSCETCHGPASMHVELANSNSLFWDRNHGYGLVKLKGGNSDKQIETCAPCHSRRAQIHANFTAGEKYLDYYNPSLLNQGLYHADGQILDEVYVYGSFLQSKMYTKGVRCTDCHNPHSLQLKYEGNALCGQCHQPGKYDSPTHHHHQDAEASKCVNCHMAEKHYMVVDGRRDHSFRIPRPDLSKQLDTPNACNNCHVQPEENSEWAAAAVRQWYGDKRPDDPHYGVAFAAARSGEPEGELLLKELLKRRDIPDIVRATGVELLGNYDTGETRRLSREALDNSNPMIRMAGLRALSVQTLVEFPLQVAAKLKDRIRLVRLEAARRLVGQVEQLLNEEFRGALEQAVTEYQSAQIVMQERAAAQLNLASLSQALGDNQASAEALRRAMNQEPYLSGVRDRLAHILQRSGGDAAEIRRLREEEVALLKRNYAFMPDNDQVRFQRGMLLYQLGDLDQARATLEEACRLNPDEYQNWLALALICEKQKRWSQTAKALRKMNELRPDDPTVQGILQRIQQVRGTDKPL